MKKSIVMVMVAACCAGCASPDNYVPTVECAAPASDAAYGAPVMRKANSSRRLGADGGSYFKAEAGRQMAYTAGFNLRVKLRSTGHKEVKKLAESLGGYLVSSAGANMTVKIPVQKADEFMKSAGKLGDLRDFFIKSDDLTDTITDLNVRLDNLKKFRTRLTALLAKTTKVEEILKIERELNRITTESERLTAQLQNNRNRVAFVTFNILLVEESGVLPGGNPAAIENFGFLKYFADGKIAGSEDEPLFDLAIPAGFVSMHSGRTISQDIFTATTADDCMFRTWKACIPEESDLEFWKKLICRALEIYHRYGNIKAEAVKSNGIDAVKITADVTTDRGVMKYMAVISVKRHCLCSDKLQVVEYFGPDAAFEKNLKAVTALIP